jgi:hypothetical protein
LGRSIIEGMMGPGSSLPVLVRIKQKTKNNNKPAVYQKNIRIMLRAGKKRKKERERKNKKRSSCLVQDRVRATLTKQE